MVIANISTPLLGLVDTAVMGHLDNATFLAAIALAGLIFNFLFWGFGFLRMGTSGLAAQAFGANDPLALNAILRHLDSDETNLRPFPNFLRMKSAHKLSADRFLDS